VSLYCNNEEAGQDSVLPVRSCKFWVTLLALFSVVIVLTMLKDWWLTTEEPNILFYLIVPISSVFGGVLSMCSVARFYKLTITFTIMLAISMVTNASCRKCIQNNILLYMGVPGIPLHPVRNPVRISVDGVRSGSMG
jgi:hypothetical protein